VPDTLVLVYENSMMISRSLQRWEPKTTEDPMLHREKGRSMGLKNQVENGKTQQEGVGKVSMWRFLLVTTIISAWRRLPGFI
jgi:hypothetical protein